MALVSLGRRPRERNPSPPRRVSSRIGMAVRSGVGMLGVAAATGCVGDLRPDPGDQVLDTVMSRLLSEGRPPEPNGSSWLVTDPSESPSYAVVEHRVRDDRYLLLDSLTALLDGEAQWEVVSIMRLPRLEPGDLFAGGICGINDQSDRRIAAIVVPEADLEPAHRSIRAAWITNLAERRFDPIPPAGVWCENEAYGLQ